MKAEDMRIEEWFSMIRRGAVTLPRFQRHEAWWPNKIKAVLENVLREPPLPIGALLILKVGSRQLFNSRPISGAPNPRGKPQMHLLDGQQRMTALWKSLHDLYEEPNDYYGEFKVFVSLPQKSSDQPEVKIEKRRMKKDTRMPLWADDPKECLNRNLVPISILCPGTDGETAMYEWFRDADIEKLEHQHIRRSINQLRNRLARYTIPYLSLPDDTERETALEVFINMNTSATPLKEFDIVVAHLESADESLHDMIEGLEANIPTASNYGKVESTALAIGALLSRKVPTRSTYLDPQFGKKLARNWDDVTLGFRRAVEFLRDESLFHEWLLPTEVILYLTAALWARVPESGTDREGMSRRLIRKAIWRASFTDRYQKATATAAFADFNDILKLIEDPRSDTTPRLFDESKHPLPERKDLIDGGWPNRRDRLGRAILATSLYKGGYDFADGAKANAENVESREYHHLYPQSLLRDKYERHEINSALNCALLSWKTNREIAAKTPKQYIQERTKDANATEQQVKDRLTSHLVPYDALVDGDFPAFLNARAKMVHKAMRKLCQGEPL